MTAASGRGDDRCHALRRILAVEEACRDGDLDAFRAALGNPEGFPDCMLDVAFLALGERPLDIAITHAPPGFVARLLGLGADPRAPAGDGFPPLFQAIDRPGPERLEVLGVLLAAGADPGQRGVNGGTALHHAVARRDPAAVKMLLAHGADPSARTLIDDLSTPLEDALAAGFAEAANLLREAPSAEPPRR